ncbi:MAG: lactate utilization protein [Gudongella sp.]|nr:lactate utilization protein [Gudongella sp.]
MNKTVEKLNENGFRAMYFNTREAALEELYKNISEEDSVGLGGSMTLLDLGVYEGLVNRGNKVFWHWKAEDKRGAIEKALNSNVYLTSSNAVTEDGKLVNKDGAGNRVASMIYGHEKVFVIVGKNKIVNDYKEAIERIENIAAPLNAKRLNLKTPCVKTGKCSDCSSKDRICNVETIISRNPIGSEIYVYIINEELGY